MTIQLIKNYFDQAKSYSDENIKRLHSLLLIIDYKYLVADSYIDAINWLNNIGVTISRDVGQDVKTSGLFLPISGLGNPKFPNNNIELIKCLEENSPESKYALQDFLSKNKRPSLIIFGMENNDKWMLGAWRHSGLIGQFNRGCTKFRTRSLNGFREGRHPIALELRQNAPITKFTVDRFDKKRLFNRGGNGLLIDQDYKISLIGCGSIGSYLADDLAKVGFNNFVFIDNDVLGSENLARHYCSISHLYTNKAEALKLELTRKYPHLDIQLEKKDVRNLISDNIDFLNSSDLTIIAIADYSTEMMINEAYKRGFITSSILIVWVEPYIRAGQAVLLRPNKQGCFKCLFKIIDGNNTFKYTIFKSNNNVVLRESGCQSSYVPYGAVDICNFTNCLTRIIDKIHNNEYPENMLFQFIKKEDNLDYSLSVKTFEELDKFEYCCKGNN